jgi:hypothetical protein
MTITPSAQPTFALGPSGATLDHIFPLPRSQSSDNPIRWILDFTTDGKSQGGVVMSQSRLREIERLANPLSNDVSMDVDIPGMIPAGGGSWIDILVSWIDFPLACKA